MQLRAWAFTGLFLALTMSGCFGTDRAPGNLEPVGLIGLAFSEPVAMPQDAFGAEPVIATLSDGTIFITAATHRSEGPNQLEGSAWLWRSTDSGATWEVLRDPHHAVGAPATVAGLYSGDSDVATSPDGWVYYSDWWAAAAAVVGPVGSFMVERSSDGGETWESTPVTQPQPSRIDRQWLVTGDAGFVALFYYARGAPALANPGDLSSQLLMVRSTDHGATWSLPIVAVPPTDGLAPMISKPVMTTEGVLVMAYGVLPRLEDDSWGWREPSEVRVALSLDQGATWAHHHVADAPEGFDNIWAVQTATDEFGRIYVVWAARSAEHVRVQVAESETLGVSWSESQVISPAGIHATPWITARGDGQVAVAWYGGNHTGDPRTAPEVAAWYPFIAERVAATEPFVTRLVSSEPVMRGPWCHHGASCGVPPPGLNMELNDFLGLEYGPDGTLHVSWARSDTVTNAPFRAWVQYAQALAAPALT